MPRRHDPADLPTRSSLVTDPIREAALIAEVTRRIDYLVCSYELTKRLGLTKAGFNASLAQLRIAAESPCRGIAPAKRLNPWIELAINMEAREDAGIAPDVMLGPEHGASIREAVCRVAGRSTLLRGTPGHAELRPYVAGLMAIWQEATGKPIMGPRDKNSVYNPHVANAGGKWLRQVVDRMQPGIPDTKLAYWVRLIRKDYAGRPFQFRDLFPAYGSTTNASGAATAQPRTSRIEAAGLCAPIYCPSQG